MILQVDDREIEVEMMRPEIYIDEVEENGVWKVAETKWMPLNINLDGWEGQKDVVLKLETEWWLLKNATYSDKAIHYSEVNYHQNV